MVLSQIPMSSHFAISGSKWLVIDYHIFRDFKPKWQAVAELWGRYSKWATRDPKLTPWRLPKRFWKKSYRQKNARGAHSGNRLKIVIFGPKTHYFAIYCYLWGWMGSEMWFSELQHTLGSHSEPVACIYLDFMKKVAKKKKPAKKPSQEIS